MKTKKKIYALMMACLMFVMSFGSQVNAWYYIRLDDYGYYEGVIKDGEQSVSIETPGSVNDSYHYFEYTAKENGIKEFTFSPVDKKVKAITTVVYTDDSSVVDWDYTMSNKVKYNFRAGETVFISLLLDNTEKGKKYDLKLNVSESQSNIGVLLMKDKNDGNISVGKNNVKGLSWDAKTATLTMNNYTGGWEECLQISNLDEDINMNVYIDVKGKNTINAAEIGIYAVQKCNIIFVGDGTLNMSDSNKYAPLSAISSEEWIVVDGPNLNFKGKFYQYAIHSVRFILKSGALDFDITPCEWVGSNVGYVGIYSNDRVDILGGSLYFYFEKPEGKVEVQENPVIAGGNDVNISGGTIVFTGYQDAIDVSGKIKSLFLGDGVVIDKEKARIISGNTLKLSDFKVEVLDKELEYDGKEKKARVKVEGLREGRNYKVSYKNNIKVGKAEIIITGIGNVKGTLKTNFNITKPKNIVVDGPKEGTKINDSKYLYKIIKAGSKNGLVVGKVSVIGLKKKNIKKINIASKVQINGVTYKVTSVGKNAFKKNNKIKSVKIGKNVTSIGNKAFASCKKLKQVKINSKKLKKIGKKVFYKCKKLNKITIKSSKLSKVGKNFVKGTSKKLVITVPKKKKAKYVKKFEKAGFKGKVK